MKQELHELKNASQSFKDAIFQNNPNPHVHPKLLEELLKDFEWIITHSESHQSIDTFAKKLYIQSKMDDLKRLKSI